MLGGEFTLTQWKQAEIFYHTLFPIMLVVGLASILFLLLFLLYQNEHRKKIGSILSSVLVIIGIAYFIGDHYYGDYKYYNQKIYADIRNREKTFTGYKYYSDSQVRSSQSIQERETVEELAIYQPEKVEQEIEYLGRAYNSVYFKIGLERFSLFANPTFEEVENPKLVGTKYNLSEKEFGEIGFVPETRIFLEKIIIPKSMEDLEYVHEGSHTKDFRLLQSDWTVIRENIK